MSLLAPTPTRSTPLADTIDVRQIAPQQRHRMIFERLFALAQGESLQLLNDHDPLPLLQQLERQRPGEFECAYLSAGPSLWQVELRRSAHAQTARPSRADNASAGTGGSCCGGCCGS